MTLSRSLIKAAEALCLRQSGTGRWEDYALPVGSSDEWVTAFVALCLTEAAEFLDQNLGRNHARRAYDSLISNRRRAAGFGFNAGVDADADSTATVLLLGHALGEGPNPSDVEFLTSHFRPDGGVATFHGPGGWGLSHPCVTPVAALAIARSTGATPSESLRAYAQTTRSPDGTWNSYWWPGAFYATAAWLRFLAAFPNCLKAQPNASRSLTIPTMMDLALAAEIAALWRLDGGEGLVRELTERQRSTGLWQPSRTLRVTDDCCIDAAGATGEIYEDHFGLLTTAMAVRALSTVLRTQKAFQTARHGPIDAL